MSTDRYIDSNECIHETWIPNSKECLPETWAPELQSHGGLGGSAWSLYSDCSRSANTQRDVTTQPAKSI